MEPIIVFTRVKLSKEDVEANEKELSEKFGRKVIVLDATYEREIIEL